MKKGEITIISEKEIVLGRPTTFSEELGNTICEKIALGMSVRAIAREDDMPALSSIFKWLNENKAFSEQYARATEQRTDAFAEKTIEIAEKTMELVNNEKDPRKANAIVQAQKLEIDTLHWHMGRLKPKKYGDKASGGTNIIMGNTIVFNNFKNEANS